MMNLAEGHFKLLQVQQGCTFIPGGHPCVKVGPGSPSVVFPGTAAQAECEMSSQPTRVTAEE